MVVVVFPLWFIEVVQNVKQFHLLLQILTCYISESNLSREVQVTQGQQLKPTLVE
jgi:hypothetical protein